MRKLYIIASVTDGVGLEIEVFYDPQQTTRRMKALVDTGFRKPNPDESPEDYHGAYYDWVREENDNMCETDIALHIEEIGEAPVTQLPAQPATKAPEDLPELTDDERALLLALKTWRKDKASETDKPEAMIFQEAVLTSIARSKAKTTADLLNIKGVGPHKISLYGDDLLAICNAFN